MPPHFQVILFTNSGEHAAHLPVSTPSCDSKSYNVQNLSRISYQVAATQNISVGPE